MKKILLIVMVLIYQIVISQEKSTSLNIVKTEIFPENISSSLFMDSFQDKNGNNGVLKYFTKMFPAGSGDWIKGITIQKWNDKGKVFLDKIFILNLDSKNEIGRVFYSNERFYIFDFFRNKKNKSLDYFVSIFNEEGFVERKEVLSVKLNKLPKKYPKGAYGYDFDYYGLFSFSKDKNHIVYSIDMDILGEEYHKLFVFNKNLDLVYEKEFKHNSEDLLFKLSNIQVNNEGTINFLGKIYNGSLKTKKKGEVNYRYELFKVSKEEEKSVVLNTSDFFIGNFKLEQKNNQLICVGFCSKQNENKKEGVAFFKVNKETLAVEKNTFQPFLPQFYTDKYGEDSSFRDLSSYDFKSVNFLENKDFVVTAEEFKVNTGAYNSMSYLYEDIMVLYLNSDGKLIWSRNINKKQTIGIGVNTKLEYIGNKGISFSSLVTDDNDIYIFLNAHKDLKTRLDGVKEFKSGILSGITKKNSNLYSIKFSKENSNPLINIIQKNVDSDVMFNVKDPRKKLKDSQVVFFGNKDKRTQFLTIGL